MTTATPSVIESLLPVNQISHRLPLTRRPTSTDIWTVEFQGSLVKVRFYGGVGVGAGPDDAYWFRRAYQQCFHELLKSRPRSEWVALPDGSFTADFSQFELERLEQSAWERARDLKAAYGSRRGTIEEFSRRSRKRLLELCARLRDDARGLFLTLTYRENVQNGAVAKRHLDLMLRWLRYHNPDTAIIWRAEQQKRGAWHFHLLLLGASFIPVEGIRAHWLKIIEDVAPADGRSAGNVDIERIHDRKKVMSYVSKYIAKVPGGGSADSRLDHAPYLEKSGLSFVPIGRFWGVVGRKFLPLAERVAFQVVGSPVAVMQFRRYARRFKPKLHWGRIQGFTLFVNDALRWLRLYLAGDEGDRLMHYLCNDDILFSVARSLW